MYSRDNSTNFGFARLKMLKGPTFLFEMWACMRETPLQLTSTIFFLSQQKSTWYEYKGALEDEKKEIDAMKKWLSSAYNGEIELKPMKTEEEIKKEEAKESKDVKDESNEDVEEKIEL